MEHRGSSAVRLRALFLSLALCIGTLQLARGQSYCPTRCLCYLLQRPRTIMCSKQGLEAFPSNVTDIVEHLDLSSNLLTEIIPDVRRLIDLEYLNLAKNQLTSLPRSVENLRNLRILNLSYNRIKDMSDIQPIEHLSVLRVLYLSSNLLSDMEGLSNDAVQAIDISHCNIKEINEASLQGLPLLNTLNLAGNPIQHIQNISSEKLRWLDMSDCLLNYLQPETFIGLPLLDELRLVNNPKLVYSTGRSTLQHYNLKRFDVSRCNLDRPGLHGLPMLTHARLSHNSIRLLPDRIFMMNKYLTHLYLDANNLDHLNKSTFMGLTHLQVLDLSANSFEDIESKTFIENIGLQLLNLSYNALTTFPSLTSAVMSLDLSFNLISTMKRDSLMDMPKLKVLDLSDNRLEFLPNNLCSTTVSTLGLRRNRFVELNNNSLTELPALMRIDLSGNRLTEAMDPKTFRNNLNLLLIRLEDNPWRCDCAQLYKIYDFLTNSPAKTAGTSLICQSPANVSGYTWQTACFDVWNGDLFYSKNKTWGFVLISCFTLVILAGTVVSIRHTMKMKRRAIEQRQQLDRAESRERLRLLQRRHQRLQEELSEHTPEPRINPLELIGPPSYEEAVQMPRLAQSLDALNEVTVENETLRTLGSVDNLRTKKRRTRRPRKRAQSDDNLVRREERHFQRLRRERSNSATNVSENDQTSLPRVITRSRPPSARSKNVRLSILEEPTESGGRSRPRPQTPSAKKKKRKITIRDGHSTDDEDSDIEIITNNKFIVIRELRKEPRSGYREPPTDCDT